MIPDREIWQAANLMIKPHGSEAAIQAPMPADELLEGVRSTARRGGRRSCALSISCRTRTRLAECIEAGRRRLLMGFGVPARVGDAELLPKRAYLPGPSRDAGDLSFRSVRLVPALTDPAAEQPGEERHQPANQQAAQTEVAPE